MGIPIRNVPLDAKPSARQSRKTGVHPPTRTPPVMLRLIRVGSVPQTRRAPKCPWSSTRSTGWRP